MLSEQELLVIALKKMVSIFGAEYFKQNCMDCCVAYGYWDDNKKYMLFLGVKDEDELPNRKATPKGWVVYAEVVLDTTTGEIWKLDYALE